MTTPFFSPGYLPWINSVSHELGFYHGIKKPGSMMDLERRSKPDQRKWANSRRTDNTPEGCRPSITG